MKALSNLQRPWIAILLLPCLLSFQLLGCGKPPELATENSPSADPEQSQISDSFANQVQQPRSDTPNLDQSIYEHDKENVDVSKEDGERQIEEFIASFTPEELAAKPDELPLRDWVIPIMIHRESAAENGDVEFYGRVVDQNGDALQGVELHVRVGRREESLLKAMETGHQNSNVELHLTTDEDGRFEIRNVRGYTVVVNSLSLQGYDLGETNVYGYSFAAEWVGQRYGQRVNPDPDNPVTFTMRKKAE